MKKVSVSEARNALPSLLREAEEASIEIVRHGKPAAVLMSRARYDTLHAKGRGFASAIALFRASHELDGLADAFDDVRSTDTTGRPVEW